MCMLEALGLLFCQLRILACACASILHLQNPNDSTILSGWRRVGYVEDFFDVLREVHCVEKGHIGTKKTAIEVIQMALMHNQFDYIHVML